MADFDAALWLRRFRSDGNDLRLDGSRLVASGRALSDADRAALRSHADAIAAALRAEETQPPQPESNDQPPGLTTTHPALPAAPSAPDEPPIRFRDRPISDTDIRDCYDNAGELDEWISGRIDRRTGERTTLDWLRSRQTFAYNLLSAFFGGSE